MDKPDLQEMKVFDKDGMVVLGLPKPMDEISIHADVAAELAQEINTCAGRGKMVMMAAGTPVTDTKYKILVTRVMRIMESLDKKKIPRDRIARQAVDAVLAEVL